MTGIRERKKKEARTKILHAAKAIFEEKDFESVKMSEIALKADLGVGTVYNYFDSKNEVFMETLVDTMGLDKDLKFDLSKLVEVETIQIVIDYTMQYIKKIKYFPKKLMKQMIKVSLSGKNSEYLLNQMMKYDFAFIQELENLLDEMNEEGLFVSEFDPQMASEVIYSTIMYEVLMYLYTDQIEIEWIEKNIEKRIRFVLMGKTINREKG